MITVAVESFEAAIPELKPLFQIHWSELALFKDRMPLAPQYLEYVDRERSGKLFLATARWDGWIAGYWTVQVAPGFHYETTLTATTDIVYVTPEHRGRGLILPLYRCVEKELKRRGVKLWYCGYKNHNPLGMPELLSALGFIPADQYMAKYIS